MAVSSGASVVIHFGKRTARYQEFDVSWYLHEGTYVKTGFTNYVMEAHFFLSINAIFCGMMKCISILDSNRNKYILFLTPHITNCRAFLLPLTPHAIPCLSFSVWMTCRTYMFKRTLYWSARPTVTHDDVVTWKDFLCYWPFMWEIRQLPANSHQSQRPVTRSFDVFF